MLNQGGDFDEEQDIWVALKCLPTENCKSEISNSTVEKLASTLLGFYHQWVADGCQVPPEMIL